MFPQSSKSATASKSFLWTFPECPVRIHVNFDFIDRLRKEVLETPGTDREVGGLLIGKSLSPNGDVEISDYLRLPAGSELIKNFSVCSNSLTKAIQSGRPADQQVVGFYRTHLEPRIQLRSQDLECIESKFNDPANVFLVIRPHDGRASAGFFYWQDGAVVGGLTFPFSSAELNSPTWNTLVGGAPRPTALDTALARTRETASGMGNGWKIWALAAVAILIAVLVALRLYHPAAAPGQAAVSVTAPVAAQTQPATQGLGLRVEKALMGVVIAWNPQSSEIANVKDANLLIWDGGNAPAFIRLNTAQLSAGRAFFTSVSDRIEVRMDVIGAGGKARTETVVSVARPPDILSPEGGARLSAAAPTAKPNPAAAAAKSADNVPAEPLKQARTPARIFIPSLAAPKTNGAPMELPQPPQVESPILGALTQVFHSFNDPQVAPPPKPVEAPVVRETPKPIPPPETRPPAAAPPATATPAAVFMAATATREIRPQIPEQLKSMVQSENVVQIQVHISETGKVTETRVNAVKGPSGGFLSKLAANAARDWQFRPALQNGKPVPSDKILEFVFRPNR